MYCGQDRMPTIVSLRVPCSICDHLAFEAPSTTCKSPAKTVVRQAALCVPHGDDDAGFSAGAAECRLAPKRKHGRPRAQLLWKHPTPNGKARPWLKQPHLRYSRGQESRVLRNDFRGPLLLNTTGPRFHSKHKRLEIISQSVGDLVV